MFLSRRRPSQDPQTPDEVTVTCFGGKKKGKKSDGVCSSILVETEGLIKDLRQEVAELRNVQFGRHDEAKRLEDTATRLVEDKDRLLEERERLREELACLRVENNGLGQRVEKLARENQELCKELRELSHDQTTRMETAREEQRQTAKKAELQKIECQDVRTSLRKAYEQLEQTTSELNDVTKRYVATQAEVERLSKELADLELCKVMAENDMQSKMAVSKWKYIDMKRLCRGKDILIHTLKDEKSRALMQLWQTTYGPTSKLSSCLASETRRSKQLPLATVEPFHNDVITVSTATTAVKGQDIDALSSDFIKNKTMSMELELYRQRKTAEIFGCESLSDVRMSTCIGSDVRDDDSEGFSDYVDIFLDNVMEKHKRETSPSLGSVSSEMIL